MIDAFCGAVYLVLFVELGRDGASACAPLEPAFSSPRPFIATDDAAP